MLAFVDRASVAPARPTNPGLARELGFLISDTFCLVPPRRSPGRKTLRLFFDEKYYAHRHKIYEY